MEADTRLARARQLAYIEKLGSDIGATIAKPREELIVIFE
jgi:hypothetical protein